MKVLVILLAAAAFVMLAGWAFMLAMGIIFPELGLGYWDAVLASMLLRVALTVTADVN